MNKRIIAWDLGATNCAAGIVEQTDRNELVCLRSCSVRLTDVDSLTQLIKLLEDNLDTSMAEADAICIGGAGQYDGKILQLENPYPYPMHFAANAAKLKWPGFTVVHDYTPVVCATFTAHIQHADNVKMLNQAQAQSHGRRVAFGIGTGLGLKDGVLLENGDFWLGHNEAGHIGVVHPPHANDFATVRHDELIKFMRRSHILASHEPLTFEKILSGKGLVRLYQFLYPHDQQPTPEEIDADMRAGKTPDLLALLAWYTGLFIGTIQLTFMPQGGIWIGGGVALRHLGMFDLPDFQAGIDATPAYMNLRNDYPLGVLLNHEHTLIGCGFYAVNRLLAGRSMFIHREVVV